MTNPVKILRALPPEIGKMLRVQYARAFLDTKKKYFGERIRDVLLPEYNGYLWDCVANPQIIRPDIFFQELRGHGHIIVMADCHPTKRKQTEISFRLLSGEIFSANAIDLITIVNQLPEDLYFFDEEMQWTLIVTHEYVDDARWCIRAKCISTMEVSSNPGPP